MLIRNPLPLQPLVGSANKVKKNIPTDETRVAARKLDTSITGQRASHLDQHGAGVAGRR